MIGSDKFASIFGSVPAGDDEKLVQIISYAVREGLAIVLNEPGKKKPVCILSARERNQADREAKERAAAAGNPRFATKTHDCGWHHALTVESLGGDPTKVRTKVGTIVRRVAKNYAGRMPNIGVEVGKSRLLCVDVDTEDEQAGFIADQVRQGSGQAVYAMTVQSPGLQDVNGTWVHKNGGHYWFTLPADVEIPTGKGIYKAQSGWVAMWDRHQVLVPPSSRDEGDYQLVGQLEPAPDWLIALLLHEGEHQATRREQIGQLPDGTGDIDVWCASFSWADLLTPDGWDDTGQIDRCGCPIFTAPGQHGSPKSATAHEVGCDRYDTSPGHAPLHVWTDNPPGWMADAIRARGTKTFTRIQYLAWRDHDGQSAPLLVELGFNRAPSDDPESWAPAPAPGTGALQLAGTSPQTGPETDLPFSLESDDTTEGVDGAGPGEAGTGLDEGEPVTPADVGLAEPEEDDDSWRSIPLYGREDEEELPPSLMPRSDGLVCLFYPGLLHSIHGESESGKSWIVQSEVVRLIKLGLHVLFLDFENDWRAVRFRLKTLGATEADLKLVDYRNPDSKPNFAGKWWTGMFTGEQALIVLDGVTDALGLFALTTKDNDEIATFLRKFPRTLARRTGAAVVLVDHVVKNSAERGRFALGGQAKMAGLDGAAYSVDVLEPLGRNMIGRLRVRVGKDKPGFVREHQVGFDRDRLGDIGVFTLDSSSQTRETYGHSLASFDPPDEEDAFSAQSAPAPEVQATGAEDAVLTFIRSAGVHGVSGNQVEKAVTGRAPKLRMSLKYLVETGALDVTPGPRNALVYTLASDPQNHDQQMQIA